MATSFWIRPRPHPVGPLGVGERVEVLGEQPVDRRLECREGTVIDELAPGTA